MPKITFNVPLLGKRGKVTDTEQRTGTPVRLTVNGAPVRFVLQDGPSGPALVHYATGGVVFSSNAIKARKVRYMLSRGHHARMTDRQAAAELMSEICERFTAAEIADRFNHYPTINE